MEDKEEGRRNRKRAFLFKVSRKPKVAGELPDPVFTAHLFQFHPPVLEPDFDLPVGEVHAAADLQATLPCQVHVEEELLLQLQSLVLGVGTPLLSAALCCQPVGRALHFAISCNGGKCTAVLLEATSIIKDNLCVLWKSKVHINTKLLENM